MSISAEDSGIETIPLITLTKMWRKAEELLQMENGIIPTPGSSDKARMVISYSQSAPHHVQSKSGGQYICDANCPQWLSSQVTLATAEHNGDLAAFLQWFTQFAGTPNISALAMSGLPRGRGRWKAKTAV